MKHYLLLPLLILFIASCSNGDNQQPISNVTFTLSNITVDYISRASLSDAQITDVWIFEGTSLLAHKVSTDADFSSPTIPLTYGSHILTFIASKANEQSFTTKWQCTKVADTFGKAMTVDVDGSTNARNIELNRRSSQICIGIEDAIPSEAKWMHVMAGNNLALDNTLSGSESNTYDVSIDIASRAGTKNFKPVFNIITTSASDEENVALLIEFKNGDNTVLYHYERDVPVKPNRCTYIHGNFFTGNSNIITVNTTWLDELSVDL